MYNINDDKGCGYDNGANHAPKFKSKKVSILRNALKAEKRRNLLLAAKLKYQNKARAKHLREIKQFKADIVKEAIHSTAIDMQNRENTTLSSSMNTLSAVSINIPECKPITNTEEIDRKSFKDWKDLLEASMDLAGITDEYTKNNVFKVKAGPMLLEVLDSTPKQPLSETSNAPYSNAMKRLNDFFGSREYRLVQRQKLRALTQDAEESDLKYLKRVIATAKLCDFDEEKLMEGVTEVIQLHALNAKVREAGRKVLRKGGTLAALVDKIRGYEVDKTNEEIFKRTHQPASDFRIAAVARSGVESNSAAGSGTEPRGRNFDYQGQSSWRNFGNPSNKYGRNNSRYENKFVPCWRCSSIFHVPSKCHAANKICRNCKKTGHIERACRQIPTPSNTLKRRISRDDERPVNTKKIATVTKDEEQKEDTNVVSDYSS
uniref:uncharacterized protein LOC120959774 isoform X1 n=1 Tax=Anopheles coluzzii TaxID=1518534 RepID=UPI0020FFCF4B|nr:uncharacterized protein LOC120959774 isoform X1 [Anopheles coluzzii]